MSLKCAKCGKKAKIIQKGTANTIMPAPDWMFVTRWEPKTPWEPWYTIEYGWREVDVCQECVNEMMKEIIDEEKEEDEGS